jgi:thymidine phosphorylase
MLTLAGLADDDERAAARADDAIASGRALETFRRMIQEQGGDPAVVDDPARLPDAPDRAFVRAPGHGFVSGLRAGAIGRASHALGAGRSRVGDAVDPGVGVLVRAGIGDEVRAGDPVLELHHRGGRGLDHAVAIGTAAVILAEAPPPPQHPIITEIR